MKEKYQYAANILACSRFGWNTEKQCIDVDSREVLETWLKAHPKKFYTPGNPFPMFERLGQIFGKDRATGSAAVSGFDAEEQIREEPDEEDPTMDDYFMSSEPIATGPADTQGIPGQATTLSVDRTASTRRLSGKKGSRQTYWKGWLMRCTNPLRLRGSTFRFLQTRSQGRMRKLRRERSWLSLGLLIMMPFKWSSRYVRILGWRRVSGD
ncbi:hypothetical protein PIB30_039348 [Stylosanthes scabra]|uniref:Retrotransposon protein n=1 Tax=Stylosanthes scabra TaxID=79078 RepID=A0ABU6UE16_9FABA|nr:hypothetical protein [Stylosanthes scabra]